MVNETSLCLGEKTKREIKQKKLILVNKQRKRGWEGEATRLLPYSPFHLLCACLADGFRSLHRPQMLVCRRDHQR